MSHPYLAVNDLENVMNVDCKPLHLLKDLIRGLDSTSFLHIRRFMKRFKISKKNGNKQNITQHVAESILRSSAKTSVIKEMHRFIFKTSEYHPIIEKEERDYDGILGKVISHKHFIEAHKWMLDNYTKPEEKEIAFFTTCASVKPYPTSPNFSVIINHLKKELKDPNKIHWLVLSNATAPIPEEFHTTFPFYAYETDITKLNKEESKKYVRITSKRLKKYLEVNYYSHYVALLRPSSFQMQVLKKVEKSLDLNIIYLPRQNTINKINSLGNGFWSRVGMKHKFTLSELSFTINQLL